MPQPGARCSANAGPGLARTRKPENALPFKTPGDNDQTCVGKSGARLMSRRDVVDRPMRRDIESNKW
jgi:hypothetical protein